MSEQVSEFFLTIRNPYARSKRFPVALLHFTAGFLLANAWYEAKAGHYPAWLGILFIIFAAFEVFYTFFSIRLQDKFPLLGSTVRLLAGMAFLVYAWMLFRDHDPVFGIFMIMIAIAFFIIYRVETRWNKPFIIEINEHGILFPMIFKSRLYRWCQFNYVILRDDLLTLDFASNKVIQLELSRNKKSDNASDFNVFCKENIAEDVRRMNQKS